MVISHIVGAHCTVHTVYTSHTSKVNRSVAVRKYIYIYILPPPLSLLNKINGELERMRLKSQIFSYANKTLFNVSTAMGYLFINMRHFVMNIECCNHQRLAAVSFWHSMTVSPMNGKNINCVWFLCSHTGALCHVRGVDCI